MYEELIFAALCVSIALLAVDILLRLRLLRSQSGREPVVQPPAESGVPQLLSAPSSSVEPLLDSKCEEPRPTTVEEETVFSDVDLLQEAKIYLDHGRPAQAVTILGWCVDRDPGNRSYLDLLLQAYVAVADWSSYAASLAEQLRQSPQDSERVSWIAEKMREGLAQAPDCPDLQELWQELRRNEFYAEPPAVVATVHSVSEGGRDRAKVALRIAREAVEQNPLRLSLYMDWLRIAYQARDVEAYIDALLLMTLVLGDKDAQLRERMLHAGKELGVHPLWARLDGALSDKTELRHLAQERDLQLPPEIDRSIPLRRAGEY